MDNIKKIINAKCRNYYLKKITVTQDHIDHYNHVNNLVYLQWFLDVAQEHSESLGFGQEEYKKRGAAFFVRKHEITYSQAAYLGDQLVCATWCGQIKAGSAYRFYELYNIETLKKITSGSTQWAFVNLESKEPIMIPQDIKDVFSDQTI